jgi:hypothetical protein
MAPFECYQNRSKSWGVTVQSVSDRDQRHSGPVYEVGKRGDVRSILVPIGGTDEPLFETGLAAARPFCDHLQFLHIRVS